MHAAVYVMQVVSDLVGDWQTKNHRWGVSKKKLANAVWEVAWRRHVEGTLTHRIYFPQPAVFSQEEAAEEVLGDPETAETSEAHIVKSAKMGRAVGSAEDPDEHAHAESSASGMALLNPLNPPATVEQQNAQAHADRWVEESMSREMLDKMTWADYVPNDMRAELYSVFEQGMKYVDEFDNGLLQSWEMKSMPTHMRVWLAELEWTWRTLMAKNWLPADCRCPNDRFIRERAAGAEGHVDPGNMVYDTVVNVLRMWRAVDVNHYQNVVRVAAKEYGERGNMSSAGPVNLRGNIVESLLRWTQQMAGTPPHLRPWETWSCQEHYLGWYKV